MTSGEPQGEASDARGDRRIALSLFLLLLGLYGLLAGGHTYSSDEEGLLATTTSIVERGTPEVTVGDDNRTVLPVRIGRGGQTVGVGGLGQSIVAIPFYLAGRLAAAVVPTGYGDFLAVRTLVGFTNPVVTAVGAVLFYAICRRLGASQRRAVLVTLGYGLATMVLPHAKTFFSEPLAATLLLGAAWATVEAARRPRPASLRWWVVAGAFLGVALSARLTTALMAVPLGAYALWRVAPRDRVRGVIEVAACVGAGMVPGVALLAATNWWRFGSPTDAGYERVPLDFPITEGLYGLFLSPGKSVFLYAPLALVGLLAVVWAPARVRPEVLFLSSFGILNAVFFARFVHWHGDHSWGPRYLIMSVPFFVLPVAALVERERWRRAVVALIAVGVVPAGLGTVMYFNQYFQIVADRVEWTMTDEGPSLWKPMHFDPYWSPLAGHARALPEVISNTASRIDGEAPGLRPFPGTTVERYGWYFEPPQADSWIYWNLAAGGSRKLFVLIVPLVGAAFFGARGLRRGLS